MLATMKPAGDAGALHLRDRRLGKVPDAQRVAEVVLLLPQPMLSGREVARAWRSRRTGRGRRRNGRPWRRGSAPCTLSSRAARASASSSSASRFSLSALRAAGPVVRDAHAPGRAVRRGCPGSPCVVLLDVQAIFEQRRRAHPAADAHRHARRTSRRGAAFDQRMADQARRPLMPNGWPIEIAPPFTLRRSGAMPSRSRQYSTCTAKASLSSHSPMSSTVRPWRSQQPRHREHRADAHFVGLAAGHLEAAEACPAAPSPALGAARSISTHDRCPVGQLARIARGDDAAVAQHRLELASASAVVSGRLPSSRASVASSADHLALLVDEVLRHIERHDLSASKRPRLLRGGGAALALERVARPARRGAMP